MTKKLSLSQKLLFIILATIMLVAFVFSITFSQHNFSFSDSNLGGSFVIGVKNDNNILSPEITENYAGSQIYVYKWRNADKIYVNYEYDEDDLPPTISGEQNYEMHISVEYIKGYWDMLDNRFENPIVKEDVFQAKTNLSVEELNQSFSFDINEGVSIPASSTSKTKIIKGWGIYRFKISINNAEKYSKFVFIKPDLEISIKPKINYEVVHSPNSMHDSFNFYLTNADRFKFVDENYLTWYVTGEDKTGKKYTLSEADKTIEAYKNYESIFKSDVERNGTKFYFNDNEIAGEWKVWCEFVSRGQTTRTYSSEQAEVKTNVKNDIIWVVYVVIAASVLAIVGVTAFGVYHSKKEKIW